MIRKAITAATVITGMLMLAPSAGAVTTLTLENPGSATYQQTLNNPCVIGDPSCNNPAGFGFTTLPSGGGSITYDTSSPTYTVQQIRDLVGNAFFVGIDVNTTTQPSATEQLDLFEVLINGVQQFVYNPASPGTILVTVNNGNGFSDELLKTIDLSLFSGTDTVVFHVIVNNATDGREEFFLISTTAVPVPEPASLALFGAALAGLALLRRRRAA
jgi:hypothetical protein